MKGLFRSHIDLTAKVMDLQLERQNIGTSNLANVNTPNYRPQRLEFEDKLQSSLNLNMRGKVTRTNSGHMPTVFSSEGFEGTGVRDFRVRTIYGEDPVNIDEEMNIMAKNSMRYQALTTIIKKDFTGMTKIIQEGSK